MAVWRLQIRTGNNGTIYLGDYCLNNNVIAMGWGLNKYPESERKQAEQDWNLFQKYADKEYTLGKYESVNRLRNQIKENDIVWMRVDGIYYFARVREDSRYLLNTDSEATKMDASNQRINIHWYKAGDEDDVPGGITVSFIRGSTLQKINKSGIESFSRMLFNEIHDRNDDPYTYPDPDDMKFDMPTFYSVLQPYDVEDLLCMWLYRNEPHYVCIPSTNKQSTQRYECVLIDPTNGDHAYIQVKNGDVTLDADDYHDLDGKVYLLSTGGQVLNADKYDNVTVVDPGVLFDFAKDYNNRNIMPDNIKRWIKFLTQTAGIDSPYATKGIMFDTNKSCSDTNEYEMLSNSYIAAYGNSARYVKSFHKGDYALFYSKGTGIIAIGRIKDGKVREIHDDGLCQDVEMLVPKKLRGSQKEYQCISPSEIKALLNRDFYFASTVKTPYLNEKQVMVIEDALKNKYQNDIK